MENAKKFGGIGLGLGAIIGVIMTFGNASVASVDIFRKDASNVVRVFPTTLELNFGTSKVSLGLTTLGGGTFATTSAGTVTYLASSFNKGVIEHTASSAVTASLSASSTLSEQIPNSGDSMTRYIHAITSNITLAGGTGTDLNTASSTKVILAGKTARLDFIRKADTDIEVLLTLPSGN
jgi:hypothetical protein